ncbi:DUF1178 family protein [Sphingomonas sp. 1P06PA]|uniref:DUF1178 family protein n=1 Tax=Sphingomonas sp. 1P06PA TaxID=554121 RepID=UPI0039A51399
MILFDLRCDGGHVFEGWFGSSADYDTQQERGLIDCPICGSVEVGKAVMAPSVPAKGNARPASMPLATGDPKAMKAMMAALASAQAKLLDGSEHVGSRFADEARAIHEGDAPDRRIHGQASLAEAKALVADGVPVAPLPLPVRDPARDN